MTRKRHGAGSRAIELLVLMTMFIGTARAGEPVYDIDIPSMNAAEALNRFAEQTGAIMLFSYDLASTRRANAVRGRYTLLEGLELLLEGTGLSGGLSDKRVVNISPSGNVRPGEEPPVVKDKSSLVKRFSAFFTSMLAASAASAQESNLEPQALKEIIVTAQKRSERLIDTPQSVSVISADALQRMGATQFRDFADTVPGLSFQSGGAGFNQITMRGVTAGYDISPTVAVYIDDVPYGSTTKFARGAQLALDVGLFDVDRIEVLRGPQGTLYGASTMGGLVKYVTHEPDSSRFGMSTQAGLSTVQDGEVGYNAALAVNAPISADKAAVRASAFYSYDPGYIDNVALGDDDVNAARVEGGRVDLLLTPTDALSIRLGGFMQDIERDGAATAAYTLGGNPVTNPLEQQHLIEEPFVQEFRIGTASITYDMGAATLTSISSYQTTDAEFTVDHPTFVGVFAAVLGRTYNAVGVLNNVTTDKFTQEIRLASNGKGRLSWLLGGFYTEEDSSNRQELLLLTPANELAPNDLFIFTNPSKYEERAAFANLTWQLAEKFDVSGGIRYAEQDQTSVQIGEGLLVASRPRRSNSDNVTTYLANARYYFSEHTTGYVRYATGYRPGGPNAVNNDPVTGQPLGLAEFEPDKLKSYEIGLKTESSDRRYGLDLAVYTIDWDNIQVLTTSNGFSVTANAPSGARVNGAELSATLRPLGGLLLSGALAFQDATLSGAAPALQARDGERLPNVPRFTGTLSADYTFASGMPTLGLTVRHVSERMSSFDANTTVVQYRLPEYTTVDLRAGWNLASIDLLVYVRNVTNEYGQLIAPTGLSQLTGPVQVSTLPPRTFGISATKRF